MNEYFEYVLLNYKNLNLTESYIEKNKNFIEKFYFQKILKQKSPFMLIDIII
jgi:hypothetical protein